MDTAIVFRIWEAGCQRHLVFLVSKVKFRTERGVILFFRLAGTHGLFSPTRLNLDCYGEYPRVGTNGIVQLWQVLYSEKSTTCAFFVLQTCISPDDNHICSDDRFASVEFLRLIPTPVSLLLLPSSRTIPYNSLSRQPKITRNEFWNSVFRWCAFDTKHIPSINQNHSIVFLPTSIHTSTHFLRWNKTEWTP